MLWHEGIIGVDWLPTNELQGCVNWIFSAQIMSKQFKPGDLVVLKSGGPVMTVKEESEFMAGDILVTCQWFSGKKLEGGQFSPDSLVLAPKESK